MVASRRELYVRVGQRVWQRVFQRFLHWIYRHRVLVLVAVGLVVVGAVYLTWRSSFEIQSAAVGELPIEVTVQQLEPRRNALPLMVLKEKNGERLVALSLQETEALVIASEQGLLRQGEQPRVYDLTRDMLRELGGRVDRVIVSNVSESQYVANVVLSSALAETRVVRAQPTEGVTLAIKTGAPIFVENRILEQLNRR